MSFNSDEILASSYVAMFERGWIPSRSDPSLPPIAFRAYQDFLKSRPIGDIIAGIRDEHDRQLTPDNTLRSSPIESERSG